MVRPTLSLSCRTRPLTRRIAEMAPYLATLLADSTIAPILNVDKDLLAQLQAKNAETLTQLDAKLEDATKNLGETEVSDALRAKATHLAKIGENVRPRTSHMTQHTVAIILGHCADSAIRIDSNWLWKLTKQPPRRPPDSVPRSTFDSP